MKKAEVKKFKIPELKGRFFYYSEDGEGKNQSLDVQFDHFKEIPEYMSGKIRGVKESFYLHKVVLHRDYCWAYYKPYNPGD